MDNSSETLNVGSAYYSGAIQNYFRGNIYSFSIRQQASVGNEEWVNSGCMSNSPFGVNFDCHSYCILNSGNQAEECLWSHALKKYFD